MCKTLLLAVSSATAFIICNLPLLAGAQEQAIARRVIEVATHRWQWEDVWRGSSPVTDTRPRGSVLVQIAQDEGRVVFCLPALRVCEAYSYGFDGLYFHARWPHGAPPTTLDESDRHLLNVLNGEIPLPEIGSFAESLRTPSLTPRLYATEVRLPPISGDLSSASAPPETLAVFVADTLQEAMSLRTGECGTGFILYPRLAALDTLVYTYVRLGGACGDGILLMRKEPTARWRLELFGAHPSDVRFYRNIIDAHQPAKIPIQ